MFHDFVRFKGGKASHSTLNVTLPLIELVITILAILILPKVSDSGNVIFAS